jgi:hypothetical protein
MAKKTVKRQASSKTSANGKPKGKKPAKPDCDLPVAQKRTGFRYEATGKLNKQLIDGMGAQPKVIASALLQAKRPVTNAELTEQVSGKLTTRQEPKRVVSFYLVQWRNLGFVKRV